MGSKYQKSERKMIIKCELKIRPKSEARIEALLFGISEDEDVLSFNFILEKNITKRND